MASVFDAISVKRKTSQAGRASAFQMRSLALSFDGITCGSAHLEIGLAPSDANRINQPSSYCGCTSLKEQDTDKSNLMESLYSVGVSDTNSKTG